MATMVQTLMSQSCGIPCQLSSRVVGRNRRRTLGGVRGGVFRVRGQAAAEDGEGAPVGGGGGGGEEDFEARLAKLQRKVTSGTGKKAELRKARKETGGDPYAATSTKPKKEELFIPPVPLEEPVSDGLPVSLGVTPYTERLHGRLAAVGLAAVLLVELATGDRLISFHDSGTLTVQVYTVLGFAALFVKYEKEKISIWPKSKSKE